MMYNLPVNVNVSTESLVLSVIIMCCRDGEPLEIILDSVALYLNVQTCDHLGWKRALIEVHVILYKH